MIFGSESALAQLNLSVIFVMARVRVSSLKNIAKVPLYLLFLHAKMVKSQSTHKRMPWFYLHLANAIMIHTLVH